MGTNRDFSVEPPSCARGCGFYGVREHHDLCSKCYAAFLRDQVAESSAADAATSEVDLSLADLAASMRRLNLDASSTEMTEKKKRCTVCNKRVGLLGFKCRCGDVFCGAHRYPDEHGCGVDFVTAARRRLFKENPLCKADKMEFRI